MEIITQVRRVNNLDGQIARIAQNQRPAEFENGVTVCLGGI
jgi:hypothetical protein